MRSLRYPEVWVHGALQLAQKRYTFPSEALGTQAGTMLVFIPKAFWKPEGWWAMQSGTLSLLISTCVHVLVLFGSESRRIREHEEHLSLSLGQLSSEERPG